MSKKTIHVVHGDSGWELKRGSAVRANRTYATKRDATTAARRMAREQDLDVIIYERGRRFTEIRTSDVELVKSLGISEPLDSASIRKTGATKPASEAEAKSRTWREWAAGHNKNGAALSDEAISRESIYGERG